MNYARWKYLRSLDKKRMFLPVLVLFIAASVVVLSFFVYERYQEVLESKENVRRARQRVEDIKARRAAEEEARQAQQEISNEKAREQGRREADAWILERIRSMNEPK